MNHIFVICDLDPEHMLKLKAMESRSKYKFYFPSSINIPEGVTHIGKFAFNGCTDLNTLIIPSTIQTIGIYAFHPSGINNLTIKSLTPPTIIVEDNHKIIYTTKDTPYTSKSIYVYNNVLNDYLNNDDFKIYNIQPIQI